jgi:septum formation protein
MSPPLYLASRSPRRRELLAEAGIRFQVIVPEEEELPAPRSRKRVGARSIVATISKAKARAAVIELRRKGVASAVVLAADTLVFMNQRVLGKPKDKAEARRMLRALSGKWHEVFTGITVISFRGSEQIEKKLQVRTRVLFFPLKTKRIEWYISTGEPFDKAGSYGIQGPGASLIQEIRGSYTNVVGLPLGQACKILDNFQTASWPENARLKKERKR